jgi:two-component system response regulator AtoC
MNNSKHIHRVLVVDDEAVVRSGIKRALENRGMSTELAASGQEALNLMSKESFDLVLLDIRMPDMDGTAVLSHIRAHHPQTRVIMISGYPTIDTALYCMKMGALDYLVKPFRLDDLETAIKRIGIFNGPVQKTDIQTNGPRIGPNENFLVGQSRSILKISEKVLKVAPTESTALITGENGTGKEVVARAIHANSSRKDKPFVVVDCTSTDEALIEGELFGNVTGHLGDSHHPKHGFLELANHGTLFLDEIGNLGLNVQAKLLRAIQYREFMRMGDQQRISLDIRIISASNKNLEELVRSGAFREDLYYLLSVVPIHMPPLRERKEDIPLLVNHFLRKLSNKLRRKVPEMSEATMTILEEYAWPGNVRELQHTIERLLILIEDTDVIHPTDLPSFISQRQGEFQMFSEDPLTLEELEKKYIRFVLRRTKGKKTEAADLLGINRKTLGMKIKKYELY